ncbi:MAG: hypothetical protein ABI609_08205 [Acidobacteriota bacterium]
MTIHLLRVDEPAQHFAAIFAAAQGLDLRVGWLELGLEITAEVPAPIPPTLAEAAGLGALRAVGIGGGRSVAIKPMRGLPVLRDVVREHFRGCALVLVRAEVDLPILEAHSEGWRVRLDEESRAYNADTLAAALRRPHSFDFDPR